MQTFAEIAAELKLVQQHQCGLTDKLITLANGDWVLVLKEGLKYRAIFMYHDAHNCSLMESKGVVEAKAKELGLD